MWVVGQESLWNMSCLWCFLLFYTLINWKLFFFHTLQVEWLKQSIIWNPEEEEKQCCVANWLLIIYSLNNEVYEAADRWSYKVIQFLSLPNSKEAMLTKHTQRIQFCNPCPDFAKWKETQSPREELMRTCSCYITISLAFHFFSSTQH